jgi:hypothetical protein
MLDNLQYFELPGLRLVVAVEPFHQVQD